MNTRDPVTDHQRFGMVHLKAVAVDQCHGKRLERAAPLKRTQ